jgi:adenine-specific DNA methylase
MANRATKATLGAFYTPPAIADALTRWAVTDAQSRIFDPSFGGCAFIYGALKSLEGLGATQPGKQIFGVDIDSDALRYLGPVIEAGGSLDQFLLADFFSLPHGVAPWTVFDAIVGNPPYLRHHLLSEQQQQLATEALKSTNRELSGRASYWAYFILYALNFLKRGGRMALVLPGAFLHADYASSVRKMVVSSFGEVNILLLEERVFDDTSEESVIVCGKDAHLPHRALRIGCVSDSEHLSKALEHPHEYLRRWPGTENASWLSAIVAPAALEALAYLQQNESAILAGDWVRARIGVVTGANDYFILPKEWLLQNTVPDDLTRPILRRSSHVAGLCATDEQLSMFYGASSPSQLLVIPKDAPVPPTVRSYLAIGDKLGIGQRAKCRGRSPWYSLTDTEPPDAFLSAMTADWPRIIVNNSSYTCTNNIYRLEWCRPRERMDWLRFALASLSSPSQLSAELVGRSYGGGVLKLEPNEFARWLIPLLPDDIAHSIAPEVDVALRCGDMSRATELVDGALMRCGQGYDRTTLDTIRQARDQLRARRRPKRRIKEQDLPESSVAILN